jgi:bacillopeptidase F
MRYSFTVMPVFIFLISLNLFAQSKISESLMDNLLEAQSNNSPVRALVILNDQVDIETLDQRLYMEKALPEERAYTVITSLREKAEDTQNELQLILEKKSLTEVIQYQRFWIINMLMVEAVPSVIYELSARPEVWYIHGDYEVDWDKPQNEVPASMRANTAEIGLKRINAHKMWELGYTGAGSIVMNIDTGVDGNHPSFASSWRGNDPGVPASEAWFHPPNQSSNFPFDTDSHGSHTMGIMTGMDPLTNDTVGVAFGAKWIAALTIGTTGDYTSNNIASFQWAIDPDNDPTTIDDMPCAIGCSWQDPNVNDCYVTYQMTFNSVEAAGIAIVFSAGNAGGAPNSSTITRPKNINTTMVNTWATGGVDGNNPNLPAYSNTSKGPSRCGGVGSLFIKPEACAPAVNVRSAIPGGYGNKTGTSMACPHVVGAIALLKEALPYMTGHELKMALYLTAKETPADNIPGEDNTWGMGIIDVFAAFQSFGLPGHPTNFFAYSDFTMPTSMALRWEDPRNLVNGDTLLEKEFSVKILRDSVLIDSISGGSQTYTDIGLIDGRVYTYHIYAKMDSSKRESGMKVES